MYRPLLYLLVFLSCGVATGQEFDLKYFDYRAGGKQGLHELLALPGGDVLMYGHHFANANEPDRGGVIFTLDGWGDFSAPPQRIDGSLGQIKDALLTPDGEQLLLTGFQDPSTFTSFFGWLKRDEFGEVSDARGYLGKMQAATLGNSGELICVGSSQGSRGAIVKLDPAGDVDFSYQFLPTVNRPAGLLDAATLRGGDLLLMGTITTAIGGIPQKEITLTRLTPGGSVVWSKKISREGFFSTDRLTMELRSPTRLKLDAAENIHLITYLGSGGGSWRTHLLKLDANGNLIHSTAYRTEYQFAGQGALHVEPDGHTVLAFATITNANIHSLTALRVDPTGQPLKAIKKDASFFDVSGIALAEDRSAYFISGVTRDCIGGERINYVARLDGDHFFGVEECPGDEVPYRAQTVPVVVRPHPIMLEPLEIVPSVAPGLVGFGPQQRAVGCAIFEPVAPAPYVVGCGTVPGRFPIVSSARMLDGGSNLRFLSVSIVGGPPGATLRYEGNPFAAITVVDPRTIRYRPPGDYDVRAYPFFLDQLSLVPPVGVDYAGEYPLEFTVESNCGDVFTRRVLITVLRPDVAPTLTEGTPRSLCSGEAVTLRARADVAANFRWPDGSTADTLVVSTGGTYQVSATNGCGFDTTSFTVSLNTNPPLPDVDTTLYVCPGATATYKLNIPALTRVRWRDGSADVERSWAPSDTGRYLLNLEAQCDAATHRVAVMAAESPANLSPTLTRFLCDGNDTVTVRLPVTAATQLTWADGALGNERTLTNPGDYPLTVSNECGTQDIVVTVRRAGKEPLLDVREFTLRCVGDSLRYRPATVPGVSIYRAGFPAEAEYVLQAGDSLHFARTDGCTTATTTVEAAAEDCCRLFLPTAFSPNDDGVNDSYAPAFAVADCDLVSEVQLTVFDRWGSVVHQGSGAWDGRISEQPATPGSYIVQLRYFNGLRTVRRSEVITLLR